MGSYIPSLPLDQLRKSRESAGCTFHSSSRLRALSIEGVVISLDPLPVLSVLPYPPFAYTPFGTRSQTLLWSI